MAEKKKLNPWRDAPGIGDAQPTRHLKEDKGVQSAMAGMRSPRSEGTHLKQMLYGPGEYYTRRKAKEDVDAGRVTDISKKKRKKDESRPEGDDTEY